MSLLKQEGIRVERPAGGAYMQGHYADGTSSYFSYFANVQPTNGEDLLMLPEANRTSESITIYSISDIRIDDLVRRNSENVAQVNTCTIDNVVDAIGYATTIGSVTHSFTSGVGATNLEIAAGLVAAINLDSSLAAAEDNLDGTYTITSNVRGDAFIIAVDANQSYVEDTANVLKEFKIVNRDNWAGHLLPHYKLFGYLLEN